MDQRLAIGLEWDVEVAGNPWVVTANITASDHSSRVSQVQDTLSTHMELALNGYGGPNCDLVNGVPGDGILLMRLLAAISEQGGLVTSLTCLVTVHGERDGTQGFSNGELTNPPELYEWLIGRASSDSDFGQRVFDVVAAGDLFDTASGPVGLAVGVQRRIDTGQVVLDSSLTSDNLDFVFGADDWKGTLTTTAAFAEAAIPVGDLIEVNIAARYEEFDEIGEDSVDSKISVIFRPTDSLTLRASGGSSFRAPSLQQSFGALTTVANQADLVGGTTFKPSITKGNPNLKPESADNINFGLSWIPQEGLLEGLSVDVDYYRYDYVDIMTRENSAALLAADNAIIQAYADANG